MAGKICTKNEPYIYTKRALNFSKRGGGFSSKALNFHQTRLRTIVSKKPHILTHKTLYFHIIMAGSVVSGKP